jgi:antitoxin VapB
MGRELVIRSDEALAIADDLARRLEVSETEVVERALRKLKETVRLIEPPTGFETEEERRTFIAEILALGARARQELGERATSNHDDLYDENGLPR